jgi:FtsP/CotA-like multicopper oxidase with cupredoxin domain
LSSQSFDPSRRTFLQTGGAALLCTIGGQQLALTKPGDARKADAAAAQVKRPKGRPTKEVVDTLKFDTPQPQPGGRVVEYWLEVRAVRWTIVPTRRDDWHDVTIPGSSTFTAFVYQLMTPGFAAAAAKPSIPGPVLSANVGDTLVVHLRNALPERLRQGVTFHPHAVRYNPEYDGVYLGKYTRAGGFIAPGEEFTYTYECVPDSVGLWPYHDHGPNHTLNTARGLFGALLIRKPGEVIPDVESVLTFHSFTPPVTGLRRAYQCVNGRAYAGNTPTVRAKAGQSVAIHIIGVDDNFHDFHLHGHRWKDAAGLDTDNPSVGPGQSIVARFTADNPGRWLYHCHVLAHQDGGMAGWLLVDP